MGIIINNKTVIAFFLILFVSSNSLAFSNVDMSAGLTVGMDYTDNVDLTDRNTESDLILSVTPSVGVSTQGSRLSTQLNYSVSGLAYNKTSANDDMYHNLSSSANAELVKNSIFLDAFANTRQVLLNQNLNASSDLVSGSQNTTTTYTYGLSPSWQKQWENYATSELVYHYDEVKFSGSNSGGDSTGNGVGFVLTSGTKFNQYFWDLNYDYNKTSYDSNSPDTTTELSYVTLGYHYSRLLDLRVRMGYENYDDSFQIDQNGNATNNDNGGFGWTIGGNWHPSARTSLDASWGERAFGRTAFLDFTHRGKRITWQLNYSDDIDNSRGQIINNSQTINDGNSNPDDNFNNVDTPLATFNPNLRLTRRLTGSASYRLSKSTFTLSLYSERLYYDDADNENNNNYGTSLDWGLRLGGRTSMNTRVSWQQLEDLDIDNTQERKEFSVFLNRTLTPSVSANIGYTYQRNDADLRLSEYVENRITANLSKSF